MFCLECGNKLELGDLFCRNCGIKIDKEKKALIPENEQIRLNKFKAPLESLETKITKLNQINFPYESPIKLCLLQLVSFGIYGLVLLYRWVKVINSASKKDLFNPTLAVILSIITLGAANVYFNYQIVLSAEKILESTNGSLNSNRRDINPPLKNLKEIVLFGWIFCFIMQFIFPIFTFLLLIYFNLLIQKLLEYTFYSNNTNKKDACPKYKDIDETNQEKILSKQSSNNNSNLGNSKQTSGGLIYWISRIGEADGLGNFNLSKFFGGIKRKYTEEEFVKNIFIGTTETTPSIKDISTEYPQPWIFFRLTVVALVIFYGFKFTYELSLNNIYIPALIITGSFGIPISTLVLFLELNLRRNIPIWIVAKLFLGGALLSLFFNEVIAGIFYGFYDLLGNSAAAITEEPAKLLTLVILTKNKNKYPYILNGLLLGASVGCGFASFESAGYAYKFLEPYEDMINVITIRGILSPFAHIVWTAVAGAALWRVKKCGNFSFKLLKKKSFYAPFVAVIICHAIWNSPFQLPFFGTYIICGLIAWILALSLLNLGIKQISQEKANIEIFHI
tara:strand:- start:4764 stop:6452 length:1689 start_codon:yes stop_codon:yes gene_type:complete